MFHSELGSLQSRVDKARQANDLYFVALLPQETMKKTFGKATGILDRARIYVTSVTVWVFLSQVLSVHHGCVTAVAKLFAYRDRGREAALNCDFPTPIGYRVSLFRERLCEVASRLGIPIRVSHLPPYCSKYNPIDHRLFCHLTRSLKGVLCRSIEIVRDAFARTVTSTGLKVTVELARRTYQAGVKARQTFRDDEPILRDKYLLRFNYVAPVM